MKLLDDLISALDLDTKVRDIRQGVFHTAVLTRNCGLAATLPRDALRQNPPLVKEPGTLLEKSVSELARMAYSESLLEASMGMATINSLLEIDDDQCVELNARDLIVEKGTGKRIVIIGHFPFIPLLKERAKEVWVIEKNPQQDDLTEDEAQNVVPQADVVGVTGTAITNHTFEGLLVEYGVHAISGTKVVNIEQALRCVSQGANFRQIKGTRRLTMIK